MSLQLTIEAGSKPAGDVLLQQVPNRVETHALLRVEREMNYLYKRQSLNHSFHINTFKALL